MTDVDWVAFAASVVTAVMALVGTYVSNRKSAAVIALRVEMLEKKVDEHNKLIDRMYKAEGRLDVVENEVNDLKKGA